MGGANWQATGSLSYGLVNRSRPPAAIHSFLIKHCRNDVILRYWYRAARCRLSVADRPHPFDEYMFARRFCRQRYVASRRKGFTTGFATTDPFRAAGDTSRATESDAELVTAWFQVEGRRDAPYGIHGGIAGRRGRAGASTPTRQQATGCRCCGQRYDGPIIQCHGTQIAAIDTAPGNRARTSAVPGD